MQLTIPLKITIDPAQFANLRSPIVNSDTGERECWLDLYDGPFKNIVLASTGGAELTLDCRIRGRVRFTREEAAAALGITPEQVAAMPAEVVETQAPFVAVVLAKVIAETGATVTELPDAPAPAVEPEVVP